jgi:hypothetical protein
MPYDTKSQLWSTEGEAFFRDRVFHAQKQSGPHCVTTVLAMLTGLPAEVFQGKVNTQDPASWSQALGVSGMKLAYCPTDVRKLRHYMDELRRMDDLFTLSYYTTTDHVRMLGEPDDRGWLTGSHIVILHRRLILDPRSGNVEEAPAHPCNGFHTKRIFRVVPVNHARGL